MKNNSADKLLLLLSSDWFIHFWPLTGLVVAPRKIEELQRACRLSATEMLSGSQAYWDISFTDDRLRYTRETLLDLIRRYSEPTSADFSMVLSENAGDELKEASLLASFAPLLINDELFARQAGLTVDDVTFLQCEWDQSMGRVKALREAVICVSEWDRFLIALTPDLPTMLKDFAIEHFAVRGAILEFWSSVRKFSSKSQGAFIEKCRILAADFAGVTLALGWLPQVQQSG